MLSSLERDNLYQIKFTNSEWINLFIWESIWKDKRHTPNEISLWDLHFGNADMSMATGHWCGRCITIFDSLRWMNVYNFHLNFIEFVQESFLIVHNVFQLVKNSESLREMLALFFETLYCIWKDSFIVSLINLEMVYTKIFSNYDFTLRKGMTSDQMIANEAILRYLVKGDLIVKK